MKVLRPVLASVVIPATIATFLLTPMVSKAVWNSTPLRNQSSATKQKQKSKAIVVTSLGTWRTLNRSIDLGWVTDAKYTSLEIVNTKQTYHVGDILELEVVARDGNKRPKVYGGDYFRAVLRDKSQTASTTGAVRDHGNGLYTISFLLSFPGKVTPEVQLVHPSEAVQFLREFREVPNKRRWSCAFKFTGEDATTMCTLLSNRPLPLSSQCDFSVPNTSRTWFCEKPKTASCDRIRVCTSSQDVVDKLMTQEEQQLFERYEKS
ncbi:PREDICTED: NXPE family member 3-like [Branchiostoma belcheri]|uniref:NXPE family member 3-like n=1 Tax=Branchiostoma belcheri TaxID=7741 RepID=A0A6P4Z1E1_BRABE|nr:PREDICTED: NXPE family member 3-like [Branchiostoma belcheri]